MFMKTTDYYKFRSQKQDRIGIEVDWIMHTIENPICTKTQSDGRIQKWAKIPEADDKYLRVVLLEDGETVHNAFFDRNFNNES